MVAALDEVATHQFGLFFQIGQKCGDPPREASINEARADRQPLVRDALGCGCNGSFANGNHQGVFLVKAGTLISVKLRRKLRSIQSASDSNDENALKGITQNLFVLFFGWHSWRRNFQRGRILLMMNSFTGKCLCLVAMLHNCEESKNYRNRVPLAEGHTLEQQKP